MHLHALGAAVPHLARLAISLPSILPFPSDEVHTEVYTGTAELKDEVIPDDEDEDISVQTRSKSTMRIVLRIGDGKNESRDDIKKVKSRKGKERGYDGPDQDMKTNNSNEIVFHEEDFGDVAEGDGDGDDSED